MDGSADPGVKVGEGCGAGRMGPIQQGNSAGEWDLPVSGGQLLSWLIHLGEPYCWLFGLIKIILILFDLQQFSYVHINWMLPVLFHWVGFFFLMCAIVARKWLKAFFLVRSLLKAVTLNSWCVNKATRPSWRLNIVQLNCEAYSRIRYWVYFTKLGM